MTTTTRELATDTWAEYFDAVGRELLHAPTSIEVGNPSGPTSVEAKHLSLEALTYDRRDNVFEIALARGGRRPPRVRRHVVDHPTRVTVDNHTMLAPMTIAVDGRDGIRTTIQIEDDPQVGD